MRGVRKALGMSALVAQTVALFKPADELADGERHDKVEDRDAGPDLHRAVGFGNDELAGACLLYTSRCV